MTQIRIRDRIISYSNGLTSITPIKLLKKRNISYEHIQVLTFGSDLLDNYMIGQISDGKLQLSDL